MKIIVTITDAGNEKVQFNFKRKGKTDNLAVLRAYARIARAIGTEYSLIKAESEYIKQILKESEDK